MASILNQPSVIINNNPVPIVANSLKMKEGLGEQDLKTQSTGGGNVIQVYCDNIENKISEISFELLTTVENTEAARGWKLNQNKNTITIHGTDTITNAQLTRTFVGCALTENYDIEFSSDGKLAISFKGETAV